MRCLIAFVSLLLMGCWPMTVTSTIDCYMDSESCAQARVIEKGYSGYTIKKVYPEKHKIKVTFHRFKRVSN